jgi:hypothetical protein
VVSLWVFFFVGGGLRDWTHFESAQVGLEQRLVGGAEVLLHTRLGQAVCDAADESLISGEGLEKDVSHDDNIEQAKEQVHHRKRRKSPRHPGPR